MEITIEEIIISRHYDLIESFMRPLHEHEKELFDKTDDWDNIRDTYMRYVIEAQEENNGTCLVAYADGVPAGFISGYAEEPEDYRIEIYTGPEFYVSDGYIKPEYRRMGIYRLLNAHIEKIYLDRGIKRLTRFTHANNHRMRAFLESEGYVGTRVLYEKWVE